jgi:hypothetical protein
MPPGTVFPFVISQSVKDAYYNGSNPTSTDVQLDGQWTSLGPANPDANNVMSIVNYIIDPGAGVAPPIVSAGDTIQLTNGNMATVFRAAQPLIDAGRRVYLPVVDNASPGRASGIVREFMCVQLTGHTNTTLTGRFLIPPSLAQVH